MTNKQAREFIARFPGARDFTKPSHFELPDLLEVHIDAMTVRPEDFHDLAGGVKYPKKETIDKMGIAAGVSYNTMAEGTFWDKDRKEYVGLSQAMTMGPDGQPIMGDVCQYGFNPEERAEEDFIKKPENFPTEAKKRLRVMEYNKVGRQRANTGARSRATLSVLGISTGFKDLFQGKREEVFLFSRVMINTKNQLMAQALIANVTGNTRSLFGPQGAKSIAAPERNVTQEASADFEPAADDDFGPAPTPEAMRAAALQDLIEKYAPNLKPTGIERARAAIEARNDEEVTVCLEGIKTVLKGQGIDLGGAA